MLLVLVLGLVLPSKLILCLLPDIMRRVGKLLPCTVQLVRPYGVLPRCVSVHPVEHEARRGPEPAGSHQPGHDQEEGYGGRDEHRAEYDEERGGENEADDGGCEGETGEDHERAAEGDGGGGLGHLVGELLLVMRVVAVVGLVLGHCFRSPFFLSFDHFGITD